MNLPAAAVLRLQIALPLFLVTDVPQSRQAAGIYQVIAVTQLPDDRTAPDFLHGVLFKEEVSPDVLFYIKCGAGDGDMNARMLDELAVLGVQGTEDAAPHALLTGPAEHAAGGGLKELIEQGPVVVKEGPQQMGHGKGNAQSGRMWLCCDTHCSVALKPQALQAFD